MIGTIIGGALSLVRPIGQVLRHSPQIITGVQAVAPRSWDKALDKVKVAAATGGIALGATTALTASEAWVRTVELGLLSYGGLDPLTASVVAPWLAPTLSGFGGFLVGAVPSYVAGFIQPERAEKLMHVDPK